MLPLVAKAVASFVRCGGNDISPILPPPPALKGASPSPQLLDRLVDVYKTFYLLPESLRYFTAGTVGNVVFFLLERLLFNKIVTYGEGLPNILAQNKESSSFFLAYLVQIAPQHWFNAFFCYGLQTINTRDKYIQTLAGTYSALSFTLCVSTVLNATLIKFGASKDFAFGATLGIGAVLNYVLITFFVVNRNDASPKVVEVRGGSVWEGLPDKWLEDGRVRLERYDKEIAEKEL